MFVSFNHLREFVDIPYTPSQLAERLTALGLEVREIKKVGALKGVFVGKGKERLFLWLLREQSFPVILRLERQR